MKKITALLVTSLLAVAGFSGVASAHDYMGALGAAAGATDRWYFACSHGTAKVTYQIQRISRTAGTAPQVKVRFDNTGITSGPTTGATAISTFSPQKTAATPPGAKFFTINKTAAGPVGYRVRANCYDITYAHTDDQNVTQTYIQNQ